MTAHEVFKALGPLVAPALAEQFGRIDLCVYATRVAIEVARYYGVDAEPVPVKVILYNRPFAQHFAKDFADVEEKTRPETWGDASWSVGIGCGLPQRPGGWDGHLIAVSGGVFGDFSIGQAERLEHGIVTGPALVGPYFGNGRWRAEDPESGTVIDYCRINDDQWRTAPDWVDEKRRKPVVGKLIRALRKEVTV